ncbi:MAG: amino acid adenylation domain-containing protein [Hassallia sp.]
MVASLSQATSKDEKIACERSPILGVIKTIPQELPWLDCRHLDLPVQQSEVNATHIMHELQVIDKEQEVAYRNGQRLVPRIEKVDFTKEEKRDLPFKEGGMYLVTGGLGGIGSEIAKYLLKHYNARLLLVGRTPLPERSTWDHLEKGDTVRERIKTYLSLEQLSGAIAYEAVDICNLSQLQQVVDRVCHSCQCELDGVIHLAGTIETRLLLEETADSFAATLRPKVGGTWVLHKLIENQPESVFISFSSVNGFFGRMTAGAYAAANRFLDSFSQHQQNLSSLHYCFAWSMWDETGLSRNYQMKDLNRARGYSIISQEQGLHSFLAGLHREPGYLLVGLDGSKQYIQHQREMEAHSSQKLCAYFTAKTALPVERLEKLSVRDRFGTQSNSDFVQLEEMPLLATGEIDREQLISIKRGNSQASGDQVVPRNELERQIASIWHQVLNIPQVGIHDNFFELGGHSLLAMQVIYRVRQGFSTEIPLGLLFETPTIASLAQAIAQSQNQGTDTSKHQAIAKRTNKESTPLSFAQQRLWFLDQLEPDSAAYHIIKGVQLQGDLNVAVLQQTLDAIVAHHEALRTNFVTHDGNPVQVISEPRSVELVMIDLKDCPETERTTQVEQLLQQQAQRPFNLTKDLMLRACLVQLSPQEHILLLVMHHIASDGWSISILFEQLTTLYQAFLNGLPNPLPELPIQYADFAQWQRQWLSGEVLENQLNYWKQQLVDATPVLELPTDQPRPAVQTYQGAKQSFVIPQSLSTSLSALSRTEGVTLFMILLAAFQTLLYRYTGQEDILVGSPIAGRNWEEIEGLIGFFVNTLVLRTDVSGNSSFRELLQRVGAVAMSAYAHQDLPFEKLVEELQPERSLSYHPIFQIMFVLQNTPKQTLDLPGLTLTPFDLDNVTSMFDLTLSMKETEQGLQGFWEYNTDLFDAATITRMTGHFQTLLDGIVANPQQHISELPLLTAAERQQLLVQWNNTQADYQKDTCLHQLIEVQVEKTPDAIAIVFEDQQLTYRELNTRANQLAHYLQSLGIGPDVLVGICVERSLEMVIGLLGILKAGGAYVPLDPGYPQERLAYMLEDSQVAVLLTQQRLMVSVPQHSAQVVLLDADWEDIAQERQENPISGAKADNFAYVIYTSGTTGKPKGVLVNHSNVVRLFKATEAWYKFNEHDVWTLFHSYAFDFSVWELWGALLYGGRVVVVSYYVSRSPEDFYNLLRYEQVTVLNQTPSAFRQLIRVDEFSGTAKKLNLRLVIFGGEALELQSLKPWFERHGDQFPQLVNMYGITETTVHVTYRPLTVDDLNTKGSVIGSPIPDLKLYILDQNLQPVPIGVPGEMYVGGAGVTQGYLNRPELTDERFIPNRFSTNPEERLYKTGDLARYLLDGDIEYLGRIDHQVKIRGFRIEIGEIEAVLAQHPEVREVVVLAREDSPGDKRLVAYVVPNQESVFTPTELRHFLKEQLPEYMVPSAFVFLEALPLTSNGKLNRRALPAPDGSNQESEATFVAPRDDLEQKLSQIWSEVLGIQPIGVRDNFFDLGGHSLLAVRLFSQIEKNFDKKLPLATLFQSGTVEALANMLRQGQEPAVSNQVLIAAHQQDTSEAPWSSLVKIQPHGSKPPFFCIHPLGGEILCYRPLALQLGSDQPVYGLQPLGLDGKQPLLTRVEDMAAHYIKEIQTIQRNGPYYLGGYSFGGIVAYEMAQQLHSQGEKVGVLAMLDTSVPGSSTRLPFWKRVLVHIDNLLQIGPAYLWKKLVGWREWGKYNLREKYIRLLEVSPLLPKDDKHLDLMGAHTKAFDDYIYQIYPGRMILLRTDDKNRTEAVGDIYDPLFGWGELVAGGVDVYHLPGSHLTFIEEPDVQVLAEKLKGCLEKAYAVNSNRVAKTGDDLVKALTGKYE